MKQFFNKDKWDLGMNKIFFSDSIIIDFIKVIYFSINFSSFFEFSSLIIELHFSNNFSILLSLYIWYIILIPKDKTFSSSILKIIFHNLSKPINSLISNTSFISFSLFSSKIIFSLLISRKIAINNFNCSKFISLCSSLDINSNISCFIFLRFSSLIFVV